MITLHTFPGTDELSSLSPFCLKVEAYLQLRGLPYTARRGNPLRAPKKKLPYIVDENMTVADSAFIVAHFEKLAGDKALDHGLAPENAARAHLIRRTLEESFYFALMWSRWAEDEGWVHIRKYFDDLPAPLRLFVPGMVRKKVLDSTHAQGVGRHSKDDIYEWAIRDLDAVSRAMDATPFVLGDIPRTIDATAYAFLANAVRQPMDSPIRQFARGNAAISSYVEKVSEQLSKRAA